MTTADPFFNAFNDDAIDNDTSPQLPEVEYPYADSPDSGKQGSGVAPTVFDQEPGQYFVSRELRESQLSPLWTSNYSLAPVIGGTQGGGPTRLVANNKLRKKLTLLADPTNTGIVWVSSRANATPGVGGQAIPLSATSGPIVFEHTGSVFIFATVANQNISFYEENYRPETD